MPVLGTRQCNYTDPERHNAQRYIRTGDGHDDTKSRMTVNDDRLKHADGNVVRTNQFTVNGIAANQWTKMLASI